MTEKLRKQLLKRLLWILHDRVPWSVRVTRECSRAIERTVDEIRHGENPAQALNAFVARWARD